MDTDPLLPPPLRPEPSSRPRLAVGLGVALALAGVGGMSAASLGRVHSAPQSAAAQVEPSGGWMRWEALGPGCALEVATAEARAGMRARWIPCESDDARCERLEVEEGDGPFTGALDALDADPEGVSLDGGDVLLAFSRSRQDGAHRWQEHLVVRDSGEVVSLLRKDGPPDAGCFIVGEDLDAHQRILRVRGEGGEGSARRSPVERLVRIDLATGAPELLPLRDETEVSWAPHIVPGGLLIDTSPGHALYFNPEGTSALTELLRPEPGEDALTPAVVAGGSEGLISLASLKEGRVARYVSGVGVVDAPQASPGASAWGAGQGDGWVVWTEGPAVQEGGARRIVAWRPASGEPPRVVGPDPSRRALDPFVVGCGLALHGGAAPASREVVRLSDGARAPLPGGVRWGKGVALGCERAFARATSPEAALIRFTHGL